MQPVGHVAQEEPGALLAFVFDERPRLPLPAFIACCTLRVETTAPTSLRRRLIQRIGLSTSMRDLPADLRLPQDRFEHRPGGRGVITS
jgi:hypothetical protein